jgi:5-methylcytosine-specific restriction protein A
MPWKPRTHKPTSSPPPSETERKSARERGYTWAWEKLRAAWLREHPLCVECQKEGRVEPATVVDHVIPHRGDMARFWDETNLAGLCARHHNLKTGRGE